MAGCLPPPPAVLPPHSRETTSVDVGLRGSAATVFHPFIGNVHRQSPPPFGQELARCAPALAACKYIGTAEERLAVRSAAIKHAEDCLRRGAGMGFLHVCPPGCPRDPGDCHS